MTADKPYIQAIGFCTYNGSLTASDGSYYFAALTRCKKPDWVEAVASIGFYGESVGYDGYNNYVICTSGNDLVLPYCAYRPVSAWG